MDDRRSTNRQEMHVFLDESGNSGRNFLDAAQPLHLLGGWFIETGAIPEAQKIVLQWEAGLRKPGQLELKSSKILKRNTGVGELLDLVKRLGAAGCVPTHSVFEKRFGICGKIIETYLDPAYTSSAPPEVGSDASAKVSLANEFYDCLSDTELTHFAQAVYSKDETQIVSAKNAIINRLRDISRADLADHFLAVDDCEAISDAKHGTNIENSINFTVFFNHLTMLGALFTSFEVARWTITHDKALEFEERFQFITNLVSTGTRRESPISKTRTLVFGEYNLAELKFVDSTQDPLVRASDYYMGLLSHLLQAVAAEMVLKTADYREALPLICAPYLRYMHSGFELPEVFHHTVSFRHVRAVIRELGRTRDAAYC